MGGATSIQAGYVSAASTGGKNTVLADATGAGTGAVYDACVVAVGVTMAIPGIRSAGNTGVSRLNDLRSAAGLV